MTLVATEHLPEVLRLRDEGTSWRKISTELGVSRDAISRALEEAGHPPIRATSTPHKWTPAEEEALIAGRNILYDADGVMVRPGLTGKALFALFPKIADCVVQRRLYILIADGRVR